MRKQNSEFRTAFTSEASQDLKNTDYFGFVELDSFACYVIADGINDQNDGTSARLAVAAAVSAFSEAPSISKSAMMRCLKAANRALLHARSKMRLKASIIIVITDYVKFRYGQAGNVRLRLYRNGFLKLESADQSLTADMVREEKVEKDKAAAHQERNNLYTYLGQRKDFQPFISAKVKLHDTDAIALYTRGIWEHLDEGELKDVFADAMDDPEKSVAEVEDLLLSRQPKDLHKYTFAALFINKVFTNPNKKRKIRRVIMIAIPILLIVVTFTVIMVIRYNKKLETIKKMELGYTDTLEYIQVNNYVRAEARCQEARQEAEKLKDQKMQKELGDYLKLIETVNAADEQLSQKRYAEAQRLFQEAKNRSRYVDNVGLDYLDDQLEITANYLSVYDLINLGDSLALNLQYDKAEEKYLQAKNLAGRIYFDEGRTTAIEALEKLYADQKAEKEADDEQLKKQLAQEEAGAGHVAKGDEAFAKGDYESAKVYYTTARQKYEQLDDQVQAAAVDVKLAAIAGKESEKDRRAAESQEYLTQAAGAMAAEDFLGAKKYYLLAKDVYSSLKMTEKEDEINRKLELLEIRESESERQDLQEADGYMTQAAAAKAQKDYGTARENYLLAQQVYQSLGMDDKVTSVELKIEKLNLEENEQVKIQQAALAAEKALEAAESAAAESVAAPGAGADLGETQ